MSGTTQATIEEYDSAKETTATENGGTEAVAPIEDPSAKVCAGDRCTRVIPVGMFDECSTCGSGVDRGDGVATDGGEDVELRDSESRDDSHASVVERQLAMADEEDLEAAKSVGERVAEGDQYGDPVGEDERPVPAGVPDEPDDEDDDDDRDDQELVTDGGLELTVDQDAAEWCSECSRYRIDCTHSTGARADGAGVDAAKGEARDVGGMTWRDRAETLEEETSLKRREAEVQALKEAGHTHEAIADELGIAKKTVDEYSRRINQRLDEAEETLRELGALDDDGELVTDGGVREVVEVEHDGETVEVPTTLERDDLAAHFGSVPDEWDVDRVFVFEDVVRTEAYLGGGEWVEATYQTEGNSPLLHASETGWVADKLDVGEGPHDRVDDGPGETVWTRPVVDE